MSQRLSQIPAISAARQIRAAASSDLQIRVCDGIIYAAGSSATADAEEEELRADWESSNLDDDEWPDLDCYSATEALRDCDGCTRWTTVDGVACTRAQSYALDGVRAANVRRAVRVLRSLVRS